MAKAQKKSIALTTESPPTHKSTKTTKVPAQKVKSAKSASPKAPETITENKVADALVMAGRHSKQAMLIALIRRAEGATLEDLTSATGWQKHSVRGAISGALKKRLGLLVSTSKEDRGQVYRITGERR